MNIDNNTNIQVQFSAMLYNSSSYVWCSLDLTFCQGVKLKDTGNVTLLLCPAHTAATVRLRAELAT